MEQLPVNVQALFSHNVTKAKELLSAAGYPTLNISVICYNTASQTDFLSLIKNMWAEAGINLTIDAKDYANWTTRTKARNYGANELLYATYSGAWQKMINFNGTSQYNLSYVNDPTAAEAAAKAADYIGLEEDKLAKVNADLMPYVIEQCWTISKPSPYIYVLWWPWVKNFNGELYNGYYNICPEKYLWMDLTLRKQMTGQ
jgi:peptide/nickel transport system substrate-binding protein